LEVLLTYAEGEWATRVRCACTTCCVPFSWMYKIGKVIFWPRFNNHSTTSSIEVATVTTCTVHGGVPTRRQLSASRDYLPLRCLWAVFLDLLGDVFAGHS